MKYCLFRSQFYTLQEKRVLSIYTHIVLLHPGTVLWPRRPVWKMLARLMMALFETGLPSPVLAFQTKGHSGHRLGTMLGAKKKLTEIKYFVKTPLTNSDSVVISN